MFRGDVYENGIDISNNYYLRYEWYLNGVMFNDDSRTVSVDNSFVGIASLKLVIRLGSITSSRVETLTDLGDGRSIERRYSSLEVLSSNSTPDTFPNEWSTSALNAVWAIERLTGEAWGVAFRIKGEKGKPNGAFQKTVFKTVAAGGAVPDRPTTRTGASTTLVPLGWTDEPDSSAAQDSIIYGSKATFMKNPSTESVDEVVGNWNISGQWSTPFKVTYFPPAGLSGDKGAPGNNGWTPVIALENNSDKTYQKVIDYTGGTGTKPTLLGYVGTSGITSGITSSTINVKGAQGIQGVAGANGVFNASDFVQKVIRNGDRIALPYNYNIMLVLDKLGVVHYHIIADYTVDSKITGPVKVTIPLDSEDFTPLYFNGTYGTYGYNVGDWPKTDGHRFPLPTFKFRPGVYYTGPITPSACAHSITVSGSGNSFSLNVYISYEKGFTTVASGSYITSKCFRTI